jgi:hypothetical protein
MDPKDKKGVVALILGKAAKPKPEEEAPEADPGKLEAAADLRDALENGDDAALVAALDAYLELC